MFPNRETPILHSLKLVIWLINAILPVPTKLFWQMKNGSSSSFIFTRSSATVNFPLTAVRTWSWLGRRGEREHNTVGPQMDGFFSLLQIAPFFSFDASKTLALKHMNILKYMNILTPPPPQENQLVCSLHPSRQSAGSTAHSRSDGCCSDSFYNFYTLGWAELPK